MRLMIVAVAAAVVAAPAAADRGDHYKKQWEKRTECQKKLNEAKDPWEFQTKAAECDRELAKLNWEQRREAAKEWREAEKKWRERNATAMAAIMTGMRTNKTSLRDMRKVILDRAERDLGSDLEASTSAA